LYGGLTVAVAVGGVALARFGPPRSASAESATPTPAFSISQGYKCPIGQGVGGAIVDGWEHRAMATPQGVIAVIIAKHPELVFDAQARPDLDKSPHVAEYAFRDPDGYLLATIRAERVEGGRWLLSGWTSCGAL
jgi:hypothetical protein